MGPGGILHAIFVGTWWPETGRGYAFTSSGGGPLALLSNLTVLGAAAAFWHRVNCHTKGCWRIGRQLVPGTTWHVCHHCHPAGPPTRAQVRDHAKKGTP